MRKLFKERKLFKGGNYMRKYGNSKVKKKFSKANCLFMIRIPGEILEFCCFSDRFRKEKLTHT